MPKKKLIKMIKPEVITEKTLEVPYNMWTLIDNVVENARKNHKIMWNKEQTTININYTNGETLEIKIPETRNDNFIITGTAEDIFHLLKNKIKPKEKKMEDKVQTIRVPFVLAEHIMGIVNAGIKYHKSEVSKDKRYVKLSYHTGEELNIFYPKEYGDEFIISGTEETIFNFLKEQVRALDESTPVHNDASSEEKPLDTGFSDRILIIKCSAEDDDTLMQVIEWGDEKDVTRWINDTTAWICLPSSDIQIIFPRITLDAPAIVFTNEYGENIIKKFGCEYNKFLLQVK